MELPVFPGAFLAVEKRNIKYLYPEIAAQSPGQMTPSCNTQRDAVRWPRPVPPPARPGLVLPRWVTWGDSLRVPRLRAAVPTQQARCQGSARPPSAEPGWKSGVK